MVINWNIKNYILKKKKQVAVPGVLNETFY